MVTTLRTSDPAPLPLLVTSGGRERASLAGAAQELELLRAAAAGDRDAARRLIEATYGTIHAFLCRASGDPDLAADLTQETYRKAWASIGEFRGQARFGTWLYRIAYTTFLNHIRRPHRIVALSDEVAASTPELGPGPEELTTSADSAEALRRAVFALPEDLRSTVTARYWRGLEVSDIAREEGLTGMAIRKRLKKALGLLAVRLEEVKS
jgi:RNA polymerase sigma-70 factor, ECF subfamily